jgi:hypothetical protein
MAPNTLETFDLKDTSGELTKALVRPKLIGKFMELTCKLLFYHFRSYHGDGYITDISKKTTHNDWRAII